MSIRSMRNLGGKGDQMASGLSIVIPAYNEEKRLRPTLETLLADLPEVLAVRWEIVVVDDGSTDRTAEVARDVRHDGGVRVLRAPQNEGKGAATMRGIEAAAHCVVMILDADLPVPTRTVATFWGGAQRADLVLGSRRIPGASSDPPQPLIRRIGGRGLRMVVRALGYAVSSDPQCGVKMLRTDRLGGLLDEIVCTGFGFDVELIERCRRARLRVIEEPVAWSHVEGSSLHPLRDAAATLFELVRLRARLAGGD